VLIEAKDDGGGGDNWSYKPCKAPVKSSPTTNQHPVLLHARCPSCHPTKSVKVSRVSESQKKNNNMQLWLGKGEHNSQ